MTNPLSTIDHAAQNLLTSAGQVAEDALHGAQEVGRQGLDALSQGLDTARDQAGSAYHRLAHDAQALSHRAMQAAREQAGHASAATVARVRHDPLKSMLIAAAAGAALMAVISLLARPHHGGGREHP